MLKSDHRVVPSQNGFSRRAASAQRRTKKSLARPQRCLGWRPIDSYSKFDDFIRRRALGMQPGSFDVRNEHIRS